MICMFRLSGLPAKTTQPVTSNTASTPKSETRAVCSLTSFSTSKGAEDKNVFHRNTHRCPQCVLIGLSLANSADSNRSNKTSRTTISWNLALEWDTLEQTSHLLHPTLPWMYMTHTDLCHSITLHRPTVEKR